MTPDPMSPNRVLHYQILERLGVGGMGVVYKARDTKLERFVALKFLPESLRFTSTARQRLLVEAKAAAQLDHANICTVHAIEETESGQLFIGMTYYRGETLATRIARARLDVDEAVETALQVAQGLAHAHQAGVIHRDIKPSNILLTDQGLAKILDFGIARLREANDLTQADDMLGSSEYMAPEQVRGQALSPQADIWALGVVLYEMLTGISPFANEENAVATIYNVLTLEPERVSELRPEAPAGLNAVLERALSKEPAGRYQDVRDMIRDLEAVQAGRRLDGMQLAQHLLLDEGEGEAAPRPADTPHNLPPPAHKLVGRRDELTLIDMYLRDSGCRIVTLLGTGGIGKTSLSLEAARRQQEKGSFQHGVYFVQLDTLSSAMQIPPSIAEVLNISLEEHANPAREVARAIGDRQLLLVLDNFEQLLDDVGVVSDLLRACPRLSLLVTSRARLNVDEEWIVPLQGLPYPKEPQPNLGDARAFAAVELFVQRAQRVEPGFALDRSNAPHVVKICRLVRGLPLGIELAAAWVRVLSCEQIATEIGRRLDFLVSTNRSTPKRHQSFRAVFEHSWDLLSQDEKRALRRLAVFAGGFDREAAQAVAGVSLPMLLELADKSLLQTSAKERFDHHPLLHQYSREKLKEHPEERDDCRQRHAAHFFGFLQARAGKLRGPEQKQVLHELERELGNLRLAWNWSAGKRQVEALQRAAEPLRVLFYQRGRAQEGVPLFASAIGALDGEDPAQQPALAQLKLNQAWLLLPTGRFNEAAERAQESVKPLRAAHDKRGLFWAACLLGVVAGQLRKFEAARRNLQTAMRLAQEIADPHTLALCLDNLASVEAELGNYSQAMEHYRESLALSRELQDLSQVVANLNNLASLLLELGKPQEALPLLEEGLELSRQLDMQRALPFFLANIGQTQFELGDYPKAGERLREATLLARKSSIHWLEASLLPHLGRVALVQGSVDEAQRYLQRSHKLASQLDDPSLLLHAAVHAAELLQHGGHTELATEILQLACNHPATRPEDRALAHSLLDPGSAETSLSPDAASAEPQDARWKELVARAFAQLTS